MEASGDAVVRIGLAHDAWVPRCLLFLCGAVLLFAYGLSINLAPVEFGRVVGLYLAVLFIVWQIVSFVAFRAIPTPPIMMGGALVVAGGVIVTFWKG
jgi:small multidrug resistance family-3 protein